jgi:hypothetical protein
MKRTYEKERVAALSAGLAIIVLAWTGAQAFASNWVDSLGVHSVWLYGPISAAAWGLLSAISYVLIVRAQRRNPALCPEQEEVTRELRRKTCELTKVPKCIEYVDQLERDKLGALMGGFAITIATWLALLSCEHGGLVGFSGDYVLGFPSRPPAPFLDHSGVLIPASTVAPIALKRRGAPKAGEPAFGAPTLALLSRCRRRVDQS